MHILGLDADLDSSSKQYVLLPAVTGCQRIALHTATHAPQAKQQAESIAAAATAEAQRHADQAQQAKQQAESMAAAATADAAKTWENHKAAQQQAITPAVEKRLVPAELTAAEKVS